MLKLARSYEEACRTFRWHLPEVYNLAFDVCDRHTISGADGHRTALTVETPDGLVERYTFLMLKQLSNRLANVLAARGVKLGDRVVVSFGPSIEAAITLLAVLKLGAVAVPIPITLGEEPLAWRLQDCGASFAVVSQSVVPRLRAVEAVIGPLKSVLIADPKEEAEYNEGFDDTLWPALDQASEIFSLAVTPLDHPAFLFYSPYAVDSSLGVLHAHQTLLGSLPAVEFALGFFPRAGDIFWTPAEWMGYEGLVWGILAAWHHGTPVVAHSAAADLTEQLAVMGRHGVRVAYIPTSFLGPLTEAARLAPHPILRVIAAGPTPLPASVREQAMEVFDAACNDLWGGPETGAIAANNETVMELRQPSPGRAAPGIVIDAIDGEGTPLPPGTCGMLAVAPGAPGTFLDHWKGAALMRGRTPSGWVMTGQLGLRDIDGYVWPNPLGTQEGSGPEGSGEEWVEVEGKPLVLATVRSILACYPKVSDVELRVEKGLLTAFVILNDDENGDRDAIRHELCAWVARLRATYEAPSNIVFVSTLPMNQAAASKRKPLRLDTPTADERWQPRDES